MDDETADFWQEVLGEDAVEMEMGLQVAAMDHLLSIQDDKMYVLEVPMKGDYMAFLIRAYAHWGEAGCVECQKACLEFLSVLMMMAVMALTAHEDL